MLWASLDFDGQMIWSSECKCTSMDLLALLERVHFQLLFAFAIWRENISTKVSLSSERAPRVAQQSCLVQTTPWSWLEHWPSVAFLEKDAIWPNNLRSVSTCSRARFDSQSHNSALCSHRHMHTWMNIIITVIEWSSFHFLAWYLFGPIHLPPFLHSFWQTGSLKDKITGCRKLDAIMWSHFILVQIFQVEYWFKVICLKSRGAFYIW